MNIAGGEVVLETGYGDPFILHSIFLNARNLNLGAQTGLTLRTDVPALNGSAELSVSGDSVEKRIDVVPREAFAQEADINVSNPAIRALKNSIKTRSESLKPFMDKGSVGINREGLLTVRTTEGLNLKERAEVQQLVEAENRDREALYAEIAKANNFPKNRVGDIKKIFAKSWIEQARPGWWIQDGGWKQK